jgi:glutamate dehydrogenase
VPKAHPVQDRLLDCFGPHPLSSSPVGSGVLVDPNGLDRNELLRLAKKRVMISEYDQSKLSKDGYRVLCEDNNVTLPTGEVVTNGTSFRNTFHLRDTGITDMFVPCGGRPESIDLISVSRLIKDGKTAIPYIVEGANLFITQFGLDHV